MKSDTALVMSPRLSGIHPFIAKRIETEYWYHRGPWMESTIEKIASWFGETFGPGHDVRILTCTGSGAREAFVSNILARGDVAIATKGFQDVISRMGAVPLLLTQIQGTTRPIAAFLESTDDNGANVDVVTQVSRLREHFGDIPIVVDLSVSFGADPIDLPSLNADGYIVVPERALGVIPGATVILLNEKIRDRIRNVREKPGRHPYALDILRYDKAWQNLTTPYSPNVSTSVGLGAAIELIEHNGGLKGHVHRHMTYAQSVRTMCEQLGMMHVGASQTNSFSTFRIPADKSAVDTVVQLEKNGVHVEIGHDANTIAIGHMGFLTSNDLLRLANGLAKTLQVSLPTVPQLPALSTPDDVDPRAQELFSISSDEFISLCASAARNAKLPAPLQKRVEDSAAKMFAPHRDFDLYGCYKDRVVGFIGAGNTVRETVDRLQKLGVSHIIVHSPPLAREKRTGTHVEGTQLDTCAYWEARGVSVAKNADDVFMRAHTVILLPTYYDKKALSLFAQPKEYLNDKLVNDRLLRKIRDNGKMDLLVNASAREGLIDRPALAKHVKDGWLTFVSDELPPASDPLWKVEGAHMTGHVGGSSAATKQRIAQNTRTVLTRLVTQMRDGEPLALNENGYDISLMNAHMRPPSGWRADKTRTSEIRLLLTDIFDLSTLDLRSLGRELGVQLKVLDISSKPYSEKGLMRSIRLFRPHITMIRTRTVISNTIALELARIPEACAIVRPGVGVDNIYGGMSTLGKAGIYVINEPRGNSFSVGEMSTHFVINGVQRTLLAPGPTQYKEEVFSVLDQYSAPSSNTFKRSYDSVLRGLKEWIDMGHGSIIHSTPSTGLMEAAITNLTKDDEKGLIIAQGKFGNRFIEIAKAKGRAFDALSVEDKDWGRAFTPAEIASKLKEGGPYDFLCFQQNETSSGVAYTQRHIQQITAAARKHNPNIMIVMDGVSGIGAHDLDLGKLDVDAAVFGSQKAMGISSGLTYASLSPRAMRKMLTLAGYEGSYAKFTKDPDREEYMSRFETNQGVWYLNLLRLSSESPSLSFDVPSVYHILSTDASLKEMRQEGGKRRVVARHRALAQYTRSAVKKMRLATLSSLPYMSDSITPIVLPSGVDATAFRRKLLDTYGFFVPGSQCEFWKPSLIRIGHVGYVNMPDIVRCMRAIRILLRDKSV